MQQGWDWCHTCGFDPDGLKPYGWTPVPAGMVASSVGAAAAPAAPAAPVVGSTATWTGAPGGPPRPPAPDSHSGQGGQGGQVARQAMGLLVAVIIGVAAIGGVAWWVLGQKHDADQTVTSETLPDAIDLVTATGPDGSYTIGFPGTPDHPDSLPTPDPGQQVMGWSEENAFDPAGGRGYIVLSQAFDTEIPEVYQRAALDAMGAQMGADTGASSIETTLLGYPARRFSFTQDGQPASGIAVVTSREVYLIMSVGATPSDERQAIEASFALTAP